MYIYCKIKVWIISLLKISAIILEDKRILLLFLCLNIWKLYLRSLHRRYMYKWAPLASHHASILEYQKSAIYSV